MRVLGLDLGSKRIGLAISDAGGRIAFPAGTLRSAGRKADLRAVCELVTEREIGQIVVGLPRNMDGSKGKQAEAAEAFASLLEKRAEVPVSLLDERWTSQEAERSLRDQGRSSRRIRESVDEVAASIILRTYLDLQTHRKSSPGGAK